MCFINSGSPKSVRCFITKSWVIHDDWMIFVADPMTTGKAKNIHWHLGQYPWTLIVMGAENIDLSSYIQLYIPKKIPTIAQKSILFTCSVVWNIIVLFFHSWIIPTDELQLFRFFFKHQAAAHQIIHLNGRFPKIRIHLQVTILWLWNPIIPYN